MDIGLGSSPEQSTKRIDAGLVVVILLLACICSHLVTLLGGDISQSLLLVIKAVFRGSLFLCN
jgi:hypothetical protein